MHTWHACVVALLAIFPYSAFADQYWIAYEGDNLPKSVGWNLHYYAAQPAARQVVDGVLPLDSRSDFQTFDFYEINRPINPGAGEVFIRNGAYIRSKMRASSPILGS